MTTHPHDDIEAYALGALDLEEARRVVEHADRCPTCAVLLAEAMQIASALEPSGERILPKPIGVALTRSLTKPSGKWSARLPWALSFASAAAAVLLLVWNVNLRSSILVVPIASLVHSHFEHHALHGAGGNAKVIQAVDGHWLYLIADGLEPRTVYALSESAGGSLRTVGRVTADASGRAAGYWEQAPAQIKALALNRASAGSPGGELRWP
jgi:hypothetical protein